MNNCDEIKPMKVYAAIMPDGTTLFDASVTDLQQKVRKWKEKHIYYVRDDLCDGMVELMMNKTDYEAFCHESA